MVFYLFIIIIIIIIIVIVIIIIIIITRYGCLCHRPFLPGTSLEPAVIPTAQASSFTLQYFPYYVWCSKYSSLFLVNLECFPGTVSKFFLKFLVTIPVAPIITGIIVHFRFHIRCISIHKHLYFNFFSASFCTTFLSAGIATSVCMFSLFCFYYIWPICCNFSACVYCLIPQHCDICLFIHWLGHVCVPFVCGFNA